MSGLQGVFGGESGDLEVLDLRLHPYVDGLRDEEDQEKDHGYDRKDEPGEEERGATEALLLDMPHL